MRPRPALLVLLLLLAWPLHAQTPGDDLLAIQDNSFLAEEAYNQDPGVVQHISLFTRDRDSGDWVYTFTQEWPAPSLRHQLSYSIPYAHPAGTGNIALNYRYQLLGDSKSTLAIAPRLTLLLPNGDNERGVQVMLPISRVLTSRAIAHTDVGATWIAHGGGMQLNLAQSFIYAIHHRAQLMLEAAYSGGGNGGDSFVVSPGVRWSYDFTSGLQIVPGVGVPIGVGPSHGSDAVLLYLSFEHPFRHTGS
ncbi:MAG: transporter [Acidobacteria bacterium]|nr:transporter [Acidobacteriota bacterium]MBV9477952.1 transporter [Acidobacteriota bacterium]